MKRFRFPLRPVAILRAHQELRARESFAAAVHGYVQAEADLASVRQRVSQCEVELMTSRRGQFEASTAAQAFAAYRRESMVETASEREMIEKRAEMNQRRADYLEAHRKLEVVNPLEQKARAPYPRDTRPPQQNKLHTFPGRPPKLQNPT